jgi:hypothetical protein
VTRLLVVLLLLASSALADGGEQLASDATSKVQAIAVPIVALGIALIGLTVAISVISYLNNRVPKS